MDIVSWESGRVGDSDLDGNFEVELKGIKVFSTFSVPDIKLEIPTAMLAVVFMSFGEKAPWAKSVGSILSPSKKGRGR